MRGNRCKNDATSSERYDVTSDIFVCFFECLAYCVSRDVSSVSWFIYKCLKLIYFNAAAKLHEFYCCSLLPRYLEYVFTLYVFTAN